MRRSGSAGGSRIIGDTLQALIGMLDWNLVRCRRAIDLPRVVNLNGPTELEDQARRCRRRRTPCARWAIKYKSAGMTAA